MLASCLIGFRPVGADLVGGEVKPSCDLAELDTSCDLVRADCNSLSTWCYFNAESVSNRFRAYRENCLSKKALRAMVAFVQ